MEGRFWYAKRAAARALDMSVRNLERHIAGGSLSVRRCGRRVYISAESLEGFAQRDHAAPIAFSPGSGKPHAPQANALEAR